jgi:uncharacterized protein YkwD
MFVTAALCVSSLFWSADSAVEEKQPTLTQKQLLPIEKSIVEYTNAERARYGLPALAVDHDLMVTARQHTAWMTRSQCFTHSNYPVCENIAMGQSESQEVLQCWMNSPGHRANILGNCTRIGVAAYSTDSGTIYWCQQFAP